MGRKLYLLESMNLKKGDIFEFGVWRGQPIEWQVLATRGGIFCISKYCLENRRYDEESSDWEKSELRQWLNSDFFNKAFTSEEKSFIMPYEDDKVTLLSIEEAEKYLRLKSKKKATDRKGIVFRWWLRSPGDGSRYASGVTFVGDIFSYHYNVDDASISVRPVILLKKDVENYLEPEA